MDTFKIKNLGVMIDCSRDAVYKVETVKDLIDNLSKMGYTFLQLYTEDTYTIDDKFFGYLRGKYSDTEIREIDAYAAQKGMELIPCIQTLAHLGGYLRWNGEIEDCNGILLIDDEKTYALIDKMFEACAKNFKSRRIHIGMDEAFSVGLGAYLAKHGFINRMELMLRHINRVVEIATKYGFKPMMWSDMFFKLIGTGEQYGEQPIPQEVLDIVPKNLELVYWEYCKEKQEEYDRVIKAHQKFENKVVFAGGAWSWGGFASINEFSIRASEQAIRACLANGVTDVMMTVWKDDGAECSINAVYPTLFAVAQMAKGEFDERVIKENFYKFFGVTFDDFMLLDKADKLDADEDFANPSKYMLYSDPFLGIFDDTVNLEKVAHYKNLRKQLNAVPENKYSYIFQNAEKLCAVMEYKYALGVKTRALYKKKDMAGLTALIKEYGIVERRLRAFYKTFSIQWNTESKTYGFEKHDIRLGGLIMRIRHCKKRLEEYCAGKTSEIAELNEEILQLPRYHYPWSKNYKSGQSVYYNGWSVIAQIKPLFQF